MAAFWQYFVIFRSVINENSDQKPETWSSILILVLPTQSTEKPNKFTWPVLPPGPPKLES